MTDRHEFPFIQVGWFKHEMDFRINSSIAELSLEEMTSLRAMLVVAIGTAEDMWRRRRNDEAMTDAAGVPQ